MCCSRLALFTLLSLALIAKADSDEGGSSSSAGEGGSGGDEEMQNRIATAHGIMMGIAFAVLFPLGAIWMRLLHFRGLVWFHAGWQLFAYLIALAAFGLGVWLAVVTDQLTASNGHPIIGIIVIGVLLLQPFGGLLHHIRYVKTQHPTVWGFIHRWTGRTMLVLGVINGGLGLDLAGENTKGEIAYGVIAGFFYLLWLLVVIFTEVRRRRAGAGVRGKTSMEGSGGSGTAV